MSEQLVIEVSSRTAGKHVSRGLRKDKMVPAVVYGPKTTNVSFTVSERDAVKYGKHGFENSIFEFKSADPKLNGLKVLRKSLDIHPLSRRPIHMDFFAPDMTKTVRVSIELRFSGKSIGVAEGGLFSIVRRDVEIECLPTAIPESFDVDITNLGLNESLHVSDVKFPDGVKLMTSEQETIATCAIVEEVVAATPEVAVAEGAAAAPGAAPGAPGATPAAAAGAAPAGGDAKKDKK